MITYKWVVEKDVDNKKSYPQIKEAALFLQKNEVVAFPTETVYGLGANAQSDQAVAKIFKAKGRPSDNPLIVHIADYTQLQELVDKIPEKAEKLMNAFWPGPLTLIFPKKKGAVSDLVTAGLETIAVRMPDHPVASALISAARLPLAAPSANRSGRPSPTTADHVIGDLDGKISGVVDGGATGVGLESTVIDCSQDTFTILRPGGISKEEIEAIIGAVDYAMTLDKNVDKPRSPGMKYKHYAPIAPLFLVAGDHTWIQELINEKRKAGFKVGMLASSETASHYDATLVLDGGSRHELESVAHSLYQNLRTFDQVDLDVIFSEVFPETGVGMAIMNRLDKAAGHKWIHEK